MRITLLVVGLLLALIVIGSFFVDEPLRRVIERRMNASMEGYTVRIERLSFHPLGFGLTLYGLTFAQEAFPDPPVLDVAVLDAGVEWKALIRAKLVANFSLDRPKLHVHLEHLRQEMKDPTPVTDKGWQDAFEAIYPLKINEVVFSPDRDYPSGLRARAVVFENGTLNIEGNADFMKEPHLGVKANIGLSGVPLDYVKPVSNRYNVNVTGGSLSAEGLVEYAPTIQVADLRSAEIAGVKIEYIPRRRTRAWPRRRPRP